MSEPKPPPPPDARREGGEKRPDQTQPQPDPQGPAMTDEGATPSRQPDRPGGMIGEG